MGLSNWAVMPAGGATRRMLGILAAPAFAGHGRRRLFAALEMRGGDSYSLWLVRDRIRRLARQISADCEPVHAWAVVVRHGSLRGNRWTVRTARMTILGEQ